jgi:hypothetical protein
MKLPSIFCLAALALVSMFGCGGKKPPATESPASKAPSPIAFSDMTRSAGIEWVHNPCRTGRKLLPETVGGGGGFIDYNHDGFLDILLVNGAPLPGYRGPTPHLALYRNNGNGTFTDVTHEAGLDMTLYGFGAAVGDYDNDGWPDLYIMALDGNRLYHNDHGHFRDVTKVSGLGVHGFTTAAAWIDYDRDGKLDLFVGDYVEWTAATDLPCGPPGARQYCPPNQYKGAKPYLFHNRGDGTFEDVSEKAGIRVSPGKTLGIACYDFDGDGWPDIYLANDTVPDVMFINQHNGTFVDKGLQDGIALGSDGNPTGSMGVDVATPFGDGRVAIAVGTFAAQEASLFCATGPGAMLFENRKSETGLGDATRQMTTFGAVFADFDLDGWPDLVLANGHIDDDPSLTVDQRRVPYRQVMQLFRNQGNGTFQEVAHNAGLTGNIIGRAVAVGDIDNDGKPDLLVFENGGPVRLWHNETKTTSHWLGLELEGTKSPRDGTGCLVTVTASGWKQSRFATTARGYLSACDPRIHFGLGVQTRVDVEIRWPSGRVSHVNAPPVDRYLHVVEPSA